MPEDPNAKPTTSEEDGKNPAGEPQGKETPPKPEETDKKFTQADLDRIAAKTRKEEQDKAKAAKEKEEKERLEQQAKEQGEHKELAEKYEDELKELRPQLESATAEIEKYKSTVADIVKAELKALPEEVRDISPAQYAEDKSLTNPLDVLAWLPKGKALAEKLNGQSAVRGAKPSPRANGAHANPDADKQAAAEARRAYRD